MILIEQIIFVINKDHFYKVIKDKNYKEWNKILINMKIKVKIH